MPQICIWYLRAYRKDGKVAKRPREVFAYYTPLKVCERCGRRGSTAWVRRWWYSIRPCEEPLLCIGCFNKIRPFWRREREAEACAALARKLKREIANVRRAAKNDG